ncbi:MAG: endonuclease/exonuclease/phosphatase family protein [bacterium]
MSSKLIHKLTGEKKEQPAARTVRLSLASYNIRRTFGRDKKYSPERIARVLCELDAEVIGLQEVDSRLFSESGLDQLSYLAEEAGYWSIAGPTVYNENSNYGNALLTRLPVLSIQRIDLSVAGREPRGAVYAELEKDGWPISLITTHLGLKRKERLYQVKRLLELIDVKQRMVLMGDFNEWKVKSLPTRLLEDRFGKEVRMRTYPTWLPLFRLDWIWVVPRQAIREVKTHSSPEARIASDHLPVRANVEWAIK